MSNQRFSERIHVLMDQAEVKDIDDWSFAQRIRSRGEAVRRLVARGLRLPARTANTPEATTDEEATLPLPAPARPAGGWPWETDEAQHTTKALNVDIPARLKLQLDWLIHQQTETQKVKVVVQEIIRQWLERELRRFGIEP